MRRSACDGVLVLSQKNRVTDGIVFEWIATFGRNALGRCVRAPLIQNDHMFGLNINLIHCRNCQPKWMEIVRVSVVFLASASVRVEFNFLEVMRNVFFVCCARTNTEDSTEHRSWMKNLKLIDWKRATTKPIIVYMLSVIPFHPTISACRWRPDAFSVPMRTNTLMFPLNRSANCV